MSNPYAPPSRGSRPTPPPGAPARDGEPQPSGGQPHPAGGEPPPSGGEPSRAPGPGRPGGTPGAGGPGGTPGAGGPGGTRGPWRPPAEPRRPVDPEALADAQRQVLHLAVLLLASFVSIGLPLPWQAAGLLVVGVTLVAGVRTFRTLGRVGVRGLLGPVVGVMLALTGWLALTLVTALALWPVQMERQECLQGALTIAATERCEQAYLDGISERLGTRPPG